MDRPDFVLNTDLYQIVFYESDTINFKFTIILITATSLNKFNFFKIIIFY